MFRKGPLDSSIFSQQGAQSSIKLFSETTISIDENRNTNVIQSVTFKAADSDDISSLTKIFSLMSVLNKEMLSLLLSNVMKNDDIELEEEKTPLSYSDYTQSQFTKELMERLQSEVAPVSGGELKSNDYYSRNDDFRDNEKSLLETHYFSEEDLFSSDYESENEVDTRSIGVKAAQKKLDQFFDKAIKSHLDEVKRREIKSKGMSDEDSEMNEKEFIRALGKMYDSQVDAKMPTVKVGFETTDPNLKNAYHAVGGFFSNLVQRQAVPVRQAQKTGADTEIKPRPPLR